MMIKRTLSAAPIALTLAALLPLLAVTPRAQEDAGPSADGQGAFRFKSGVELINVTTTVSDSSGRFVSGLSKDDFVVYEDDQPMELTHFSAERVPVSLGIVLDTSGSMAGTKIQEAQSALDRFLYDLLGKDDEIFLYRFSNFPVLLQEWTSDRRLLSRALDRVAPNGGTAMYDAVADAVPLAEQGQHRKKALLVISDGNDTSSQTSIRELKQQIRESEVLVYAIGLDGESEAPTYRRPPQQPPRLPIPLPFPVPGRGPGRRFPLSLGAQQGGWRIVQSDDRVNVAALRDMTDDSGGRTEVIRNPRDLNPATVSIADELSKQYYLGYQASGKKDGRWHSIRVEVRGGRYVVRARKGYVAS
jgi:Ca-activated chloride channel homolog